MLFVYNFLQIILVVILSPFLLAGTIFKVKYRGRILKRLGYGLAATAGQIRPGRVRIWIHALSVGEVSSARSLVAAVRAAFPEAVIIFSATTQSGEELALNNLQNKVDCFVPFPLDFYWTVRKFISVLAPDLFLLVETDFWPNLLGIMHKRGTPIVLVNGRVSEDSFLMYRKFRPFFLPMFRSFSYLAMQSGVDKAKMIDLGLSPDRLMTPGNLKYEAVLPENVAVGEMTTCRFIPQGKRVFIAGSTHAGEEEIVFGAYRRLRDKFPDLFLIVAPRNVERANEVAVLAEEQGLAVALRSKFSEVGSADLLLLDTLGELSLLYRFCDFAFIGGSLVRERGHNPLEASIFAKPVIFGPYMEDFVEVARDLLAAEGAVQVSGEDDIFESGRRFLEDEIWRRNMGERGQAMIEGQRGVTARYIGLIATLIGKGGRG
ncbi:MAG: hypothetical protein KKB30_12100 [Proteobacteria bacterium]|nr:hypothetical protein [Pseudomonadota bacterium]MBU1715213.1 hypothetical protein [Pseudomonadota bacterium]